MIFATKINKTVINYRKLHDELLASSMGSMFESLGTSEENPGELCLFTEGELLGSELTVATDIVINFIDFTTAESLATYLDENVFPFIKDLINKFASENIAMGITQLNKTGPVLGLFAKQYDVHSDGFPFSLKDALDTGSLYEAFNILNYLVSNSTEYAGLEPFISTDRLNDMAAEILDFLT